MIMPSQPTLLYRSKVSKVSTQLHMYEKRQFGGVCLPLLVILFVRGEKGKGLIGADPFNRTVYQERMECGGSAILCYRINQVALEESDRDKRRGRGRAHMAQSLNLFSPFPNTNLSQL